MAAESKTKHYVNVFLRYFVLILVGLIMIYPLVWMVGATFKSNAEIFSSIGFIPKNPTLEGYKKAMESYGGAINVWKAMLNTFSYVIPKVVFTMISATVTAYGFGRFEFKGRGILFSVLMATLFLPQVVLNVPQFIMFSKMGWVDSKLYLPIIVPTLFATDTLFVFQLIQFLRNVPKELDEAAKIDGCGEISAFVRVILPLSYPIVFSVSLIMFLNTWSQFQIPLILASSMETKPMAIVISEFVTKDSVEYGLIAAAGIVSLIPPALAAIIFRKYLISGMVNGSVKG